MPLLSPRASATNLQKVASFDVTQAGELSEGISLDRRETGFRSGMFKNCANPSCSSGWLHLWRTRTTPVFEGGWTCSRECTVARLRSAITRELGGSEATRSDHRHRIPIGLVMLEHGWITQAQLREALDAQKRAGKGRLGEWLVRQGAVHEPVITRALALQWSCPVLSVEFHDPEEVGSAIPRLFVDAFAALPLRVTAGRTLYLGFKEALDPALAFAIERMTGMRVMSGIVQESRFDPAHARMLKAKFPPVELIESASETAAALALARSMERARPSQSRLVRVHECLWLRMWKGRPNESLSNQNTIEDVVCLVGTLQGE
jgi:hypothetical protein